MKESIVRITTADTKKTYEFPNKDNPHLWEVKLSVECVGSNGEYDGYGSTRHSTASKMIYLERETLENAGIFSKPRTKDHEQKEPFETAEDLIIRLLEHVGYYPCQK